MKIKKITESSPWLKKKSQLGANLLICALAALLFSCNLISSGQGGGGSSNTIIDITPNSVDIDVGNTAQLVVGFVFTFDDAIDRSITWTSSDPKIASLSDPTGPMGRTNIVTGVSSGTVTITATTADNASATATVAVKQHP